MAWDVEFTDEFGAWWDSLAAEEQESVDFGVGLLIERGPTLPFPYSSQVKGSQFGELRELRVQHQGNPYRVLYAFDPRRVALLLLGGDKTGDDGWYERMVPSQTSCLQSISRISRRSRSRRDGEEEGEDDMATRKYSELRAKMTREARSRVDARVLTTLQQLPLLELRKARRLSQEQLAKELQTTQGEISKIEHRTDMYLSTLRNYVEAIGGELHIIARFKDGAVRISTFAEVDNAERRNA